MPTTTKPKVIVITTAYGHAKWRLDKLGMTSSIGGGAVRFVSRSEVRRIANSITAGDSANGEFYGDTYSPNYGIGNKLNAGQWRWHMTYDGKLNLGCQHFNVASTKALLKWAQV